MTRRYLLFGSSRDRLDYLEKHRPDCSVLVVDDPEVLKLKNFDELASKSPIVEKVVPLEIYGSDRWLDVVRAEHRSSPFAAALPGLEYPTIAAALAAEMLGLAGAGVVAAHLHRHKDHLVSAAARAGIKAPRSKLVTSLRELELFSAPGKWVLKPTDRQASVGVQVLDASVDKAEAWRISQEAEETSHPTRLFERSYLAQDFVAGPEFSVEMLIVEGRIIFSNVTAKLIKSGVHPVELGHIVPAKIERAEYSELLSQTRALVGATGLNTGLAHAEWIMDGGVPYLIECAARLPGDSIVELIDRAYGIDLEGAWLAALSGDPVNSLPEYPSAVASIRFLDMPTGRVRSIADTADLVQCGVVRSHLPRCGDNVSSASDSWSRSGEFVVVGESHEQVASYNTSADAALGIKVDLAEGAAGSS